MFPHLSSRPLRWQTVLRHFGCALLALTETLLAKMRILLVPRLLAAGAAAALLGIVTRLAGIA